MGLNTSGPMRASEQINIPCRVDLGNGDSCTYPRQATSSEAGRQGQGENNEPPELLCNLAD